MSEYDREAVDRLPFATPEKSDRYRTENYHGAIGLNWYLTDPTLQATMAYYLSADELAFAGPQLTRIGELMGGPVARWAAQTDADPPRLERYDRWGHDVSQVVMPPSFIDAKRAVLEAQRALRDEARGVGVSASLTLFASNYLLDQADIGMGCAMGTGGAWCSRCRGVRAARRARVRAREVRVRRVDRRDGAVVHRTDRRLRPRCSGDDRDARRRRVDDQRLQVVCVELRRSGVRRAGQADGAPDSTRGVATFLVLRTRRDGSRNGVRIRRLKDKLGTQSVASARSSSSTPRRSCSPANRAATRARPTARVSGRMMAMTNAARLGIALFALGNARRALVESLCYAKQRRAFGDALIDKPLMRRKLAEMIVDVEAAQALVFDGYGAANHRQRRRVRQRIAVPVTKLKVCRLGITMASDAIEIHGGNGYIETWPVARLLRDAQVNTIWEGPDNILCLDVRRGIEREQADEPLLEDA